jgi:hypothetical protein
MVCRDLASRSLAVGERYLEQALRDGSPQLGERKAGHVDDYVMRTVQKVMRNPDVIDARQRLMPGDSQRQM